MESARLKVELTAGRRRSRKKFAVRRERDLHVERTAEVALLRMNVEYHVATEAMLEHLPFDDAHRHLHEGKGVALVIPVVAGDVENAGDIAKRIEHRCRGTRQEMVLANVVVSGVDHDRLALDDGGTDRVGALQILRPGHTWFERDMLRFRQEIRITHRMQDEAFATAQEHNAARAR